MAKLEFGRGSMSPFREIAIQPLQSQNRAKTAKIVDTIPRPRPVSRTGAGGSLETGNWLAEVAVSKPKANIINWLAGLNPQFQHSVSYCNN